MASSHFVHAAPKKQTGRLAAWQRFLNQGTGRASWGSRRGKMMDAAFFGAFQNVTKAALPAYPLPRRTMLRVRRSIAGNAASATFFEPLTRPFT